MAKPPIKQPVSSTPSPPHPRVPSPDNTPGGTPISRPVTPPRDGAPKPGVSGTNIPGETTPKPVVVTDLPSSTTRPSPNLDAMITWPREQVDQLIRIGDSGLFMSKDQHLYADMDAAGIGRVEPGENGHYQVHMPQMPTQAGPVVIKIEGRSAWHIVPPDSTSAPGSSSAIRQVDKPGVHLIHSLVAQRLPPPTESGIRWHNLRSYVDLIDEGVVQVAKNAEGYYQATHAQELAPSGPVLERIGQTQLWQRKALDSDVLPAKRPRLEVGDEPALPGAPVDLHFSLSANFPSSQNPYLWVSWGKLEKTLGTESIQISGLHYQVFPAGAKKRQFVAYLQHPEFTPTSYENFEQLLHTKPWLQPVPVLFTKEGQWAVDASKRIFDNAMVNTVAQSFPDFTQVTAPAVAKKLYELSAENNRINRDSIYDISTALRHWKQPIGIFDPDFENPIELLPVAPREPSQANAISMTPPTVGDPLYRLDFAPVHFKKEWDTYMADRSDESLKRLVGTVLTRNGYDVFPMQSQHRYPKLVFKRPGHDKIYFLKLGISERNLIRLNPPATPELANPLLPSQIGVEALLELSAANARNNVIWLLGGVQTTSSGWRSVFIMKER